MGWLCLQWKPVRCWLAIWLLVNRSGLSLPRKRGSESNHPHIIIWATSWENRNFAYAKTKAQIRFAVTAKLISAFGFTTRIVKFLFFLNPKFQAFDHFLRLHRPVYVGPGRKPQRPVFSHQGSYIITPFGFVWLYLKHMLDVKDSWHLHFGQESHKMEAMSQHDLSCWLGRLHFGQESHKVEATSLHDLSCWLGCKASIRKNSNWDRAYLKFHLEWICRRSPRAISQTLIT